jgi:hypothetical protein
VKGHRTTRSASIALTLPKTPPRLISLLIGIVVLVVAMNTGAASATTAAKQGFVTTTSECVGAVGLGIFYHNDGPVGSGTISFTIKDSVSGKNLTPFSGDVPPGQVYTSDIPMAPGTAYSFRAESSAGYSELFAGTFTCGPPPVVKPPVAIQPPVVKPPVAIQPPVVKPPVAIQPPTANNPNPLNAGFGARTGWEDHVGSQGSNTSYVPVFGLVLAFGLILGAFVSRRKTCEART